MGYKVIQTALPEETETHIYLDNYTQEIIVYTNHSWTIRRLLRKGLKPSKAYRYEDGIDACEFILPFAEMGVIVKSSLFKFPWSIARNAENAELTDMDDELTEYPTHHPDRRQTHENMELRG